MSQLKETREKIGIESRDHSINLLAETSGLINGIREKYDSQLAEMNQKILLLEDKVYDLISNRNNEPDQAIKSAINQEIDDLLDKIKCLIKMQVSMKEKLDSDIESQIKSQEEKYVDIGKGFYDLIVSLDKAIHE